MLVTAGITLFSSSSTSNKNAPFTIPVPLPDQIAFDLQDLRKRPVIQHDLNPLFDVLELLLTLAIHEVFSPQASMRLPLYIWLENPRT
jgi:hypothetical protein